MSACVTSNQAYALAQVCSDTTGTIISMYLISSEAILLRSSHWPCSLSNPVSLSHDKAISPFLKIKVSRSDPWMLDCAGNKCISRGLGHGQES